MTPLRNHRVPSDPAIRRDASHAPADRVAGGVPGGPDTPTDGGWTRRWPGALLLTWLLPAR